MKKLYPAVILIFIASFFAQLSFAQQLSKEQALTLVNKNLDKLNISAADAENAIVTSSYFDKKSQTQLVYLQQSYNGIPVYNTIQVFAFKNNIPVSVSGSRIYNIEEKISDQKSTATISPKEAVLIAANAVKLPGEMVRSASLSVLKSSPDRQMVEFELNPLSRENITTELMWVPDVDGKVKLAWQVKIVPHGSSDYWMVKVDAKAGVVLGKDNLTVSCDWDVKDRTLHWEDVKSILKKNIETKTIQSPTVVNSAKYKVIPFPAESANHPGGSLLVVTNPWSLAGTGNNAITLKWHNDGTNEYDYTRGNNVWAAEDSKAANTPGKSAISTTPLPDLTFVYPYDATIPPDSPDNSSLAITNLFFWNNIMHDLTYQYGFDEVSGNFQNDNLGRGGTGNDYVKADAQDGRSRNNADFSTPADGSSPRMQMYLWDGDPYNKVFVNTPINAYIQSIEGRVSDNNQLRKVGPITADLALYNDNASGTTHNACVAAANASSLNGKIALIDPGSCNYTVQIKNAQNAGAVAALIISGNPTSISTMGGTDNSITIPAFMIFKSNGDDLKNYLNSGTVSITLKSGIDLDGDLDNGIISHEYTHGISNRLTAGPFSVTCLQNAEQMGEGWSDYYALMVTTDWQTATVNDGPKKRPLGTYVVDMDYANGAGIRHYPYSTDMSINPLTYGKLLSIPNSEPHYIGEVWTSALWDMTWNMIKQDGINSNIYDANGAGGNIAALNIVTLGMKLQPCSPGFVDGRDAILKADEILYNGKYACAIWNAFARRGIGLNADQGSSNSSTDQVENFDVPTGASIHKTVDVTETPQNGILNYTFTVKALCQPVTNFKIVDTLAANVTYKSGGTYNASNRTVTFSIPSLAASQTATYHLQVQVGEGTFFATSTIFNEPVADNAVPSTFIATTNSTKNWAATSTNHSAPYSLRATAMSSASEQVLTSASPVLVSGHMQLSFWHRYITEPYRDGGVVELSLDGTNWFDAGPYMVENGYNAVINTASSLNGKEAFSGSISNFIQTVINLSAFQNQHVYYRFRLVTDAQTGSLGWYVDDIMIKKMAAVYNIARVLDNSNNVISLSDTITAITSALPVNWTSFTAQKDGNQALLKWVTAQEMNSDNYSVERSIDGVHFVTIGSVKAGGDVSVTSHYEFHDQSPIAGINFYRIRLNDKDGKVQYSETRAVAFDELLNNKINLSPNPARSEAALYVPGNKSVLKVKVIDATGRIMRSYEMKTAKLVIPVKDLASGVYYINITGQNIDMIKKMVKE